MKFSIVTPSLGQLEWLKLCASSVADQENVEVEHIIQDGGTGAELETWAGTQSGLSLHVEKDQGMWNAINRGLRRASGDICGQLNCDEQYLPGTLSAVNRFFGSHPNVEVVFGDVVLTDKIGKPLAYRRGVLPSAGHTRLVHLNTFTCATFFHHRLLDRGLFLSEQWKCIGDAVWVNDLIEAKVKMAYIPVPLTVFTLTDHNLGQSQRSFQEIERWRSQPGAPPKWVRPLFVLQHRLRKLLAGAYRRRSVEISIYTFASPIRRHKFFATKLDYRWPISTGKGTLALEDQIT